MSFQVSTLQSGRGERGGGFLLPFANQEGRTSRRMAAVLSVELRAPMPVALLSGAWVSSRPGKKISS